MKIRLLLLLTFLFHTCVFAQVEIGSWRSHLPASQFEFVGFLDNKIFGANSSGIIVLDETDQSLEFLSKINVLVDAGITSFKCSEENNACVVGYENGNIDIITRDLTVFNQPALKNNYIVGNKRINDIFFIDSTALLSTGVGFLSLDLKTFNINADRKERVNNNQLQITHAHFYHDSIFFSTQMGIYACKYNGLFEDEPFIKMGFDLEPSSIDQFYEINGELFFTYMIDSLYTGDSIYVKNGNTFSRINWLAGDGIKYVDYRNDSILVTHPDHIGVYNLDFEQLINIFTFGDDSGLNPKQALFHKNGNIVVADLSKGLSITPIENQFNSKIYGISSPNSAQISVLTNIDSDIFAFPGGSEYTYNNPIVHQYSDDKWTSTNTSSAQFSTLRNTNGIVKVDGEYFISTEKVGIAQTDENLRVLELFDYTNSTVQDAEPNIPYDYCGITDIVSTSSGAIYALNNKVPNPLIIRTPEGNWLSTSFPEVPSPKTGDIIASNNGFLVLNIIDVGVLIYNTNNTESNISDDSYRLLTTSPTNGNLPSGNVTCFALDQDGELWIGTDAGIAVIYSLQSAFNSNFDGAQKIIVNQDGYNGYLFATETVEAIAVDGANRKWIGTAGSGLFLISADGQEQIHNFTTENSPLLSNKVADLAIHPTSGEVFIASEKGLMSYRSDATSGASSFDELIPFPNPVKPGYNGTIAIKNLAENSYVRITDQGGNLVFETTSLGGQAVWDGKTSEGKPVPSGVYLVFANGGIGNRGQTGKIMIFR